jgi:hypothetical protein
LATAGQALAGLKGQVEVELRAYAIGCVDF